ncbi:MAG: HAD-IIIA family hydrolase, partial [Candidatus Omnitrophica bacterium]|nr:HAD-IIIA family hydrolase [Candidatus Omnitrophota bacterium]
MRVVFLDRDGVINKDPAGKMYVTKWKDFSFLPRAKRAVCLLCKNGFKVVLISNQAGVGKGLFSKKKLAFITDNMQKALKKSGGRVHGVFYCTHRSEDDCNCRKPKAGLIHMATKRFPCDLTKTYFIGDTIRDVMAA